MMIVHVFLEDDVHDQQGHMDDWFGAEPPSGNPPEAVCACGAHLFILDDKRKVAGCYHRQRWSPWKELR